MFAYKVTEVNLNLQALLDKIKDLARFQPESEPLNPNQFGVVSLQEKSDLFERNI